MCAESTCSTAHRFSTSSRTCQEFRRKGSVAGGWRRPKRAKSARDAFVHLGSRGRPTQGAPPLDTPGTPWFGCQCLLVQRARSNPPAFQAVSFQQVGSDGCFEPAEHVGLAVPRVPPMKKLPLAGGAGATF